MRQAKREVKNFKEIISIIQQCDVIRLAFHDGEYPYMVPLNFGYVVEGDIEAEDASLYNCSITFFFHGAMEGKKYEVMEKNPKAFFEMDCNHQVVAYGTDNPAGAHCSFMYESVMGKGVVEFIEDEEEKLKYLTILTDRYHTEHFVFNPAAVPRTKVFKLTVQEMTAKRRPDPR